MMMNRLGEITNGYFDVYIPGLIYTIHFYPNDTYFFSGVSEDDIKSNVKELNNNVQILKATRLLFRSTWEIVFTVNKEITASELDGLLITAYLMGKKTIPQSTGTTIGQYVGQFVGSSINSAATSAATNINIPVWLSFVGIFAIILLLVKE